MMIFSVESGEFEILHCQPLDIPVPGKGICNWSSASNSKDKEIISKLIDKLMP